jgi:hypothetical protein
MIKNIFNLFKLKFGLHPETKKSVAQSYQRPPSISEKLPWMEYDAASKCFLLDDGYSVAAVFELGDVASEARPEAYLTQLQIGLQGIFQDVFPAYFDNQSPWIAQFFTQDELSLKNYYEQCEAYVKPAAQKRSFTRTYFAQLKTHLRLLTRACGLFVDTKVSGLVFRGKRRRVRLVIYRRLHSGSKLRRGRSAAQDLHTVSQTLVAKLEGCGVKVVRYTGKEFYEWMVRWFNPAPRIGDGDADRLLERCPYPGDDALPFGYDFSEKLFFSVPESDQQKGVWYFDGQPHKYVTVLGLSSLPKIGHLSLERSFGNYWYSLLDKFPAGSVFQLTVIIQNQETVKNHIFQIEHSTKRASSTEADMAREDCALAKRAIESGNYFFPTVMGVYLRGDNLDDLYDKETEIETLIDHMDRSLGHLFDSARLLTRQLTTETKQQLQAHLQSAEKK